MMIVVSMRLGGSCDLPDVGVMIERRRMKFVDRILDVEHLACLIYVR